MHDPPSQPPTAAVAPQSQPGKHTAWRWASVAALVLASMAIWLPLMHYIYSSDNNSSSSSGSDSGDTVSTIFAIIFFIAIVIALPAGVAALAPLRPFLVGTLAAAIPALIGLAEYPSNRAIPDSQYALAFSIIVSAIGLLLGVLPTALIRVRLRTVWLKQEHERTGLAFAPIVQEAPASGSVWPPPPSSTP